MDKKLIKEAVETLITSGITDPDTARFIWELGDVESAKKLLLKHISEFPNNAEGYLILMKILVETNASEKEIQELWAKVQEVDLKGRESYYLMGILFAEFIGNEQLKEDLFQEGLLLSPDSTEILYLFAKYCIENQKFNEIDQVICRVLKFFSRHSFSFHDELALRLVIGYYVEQIAKNERWVLIENIISVSPSIIQWDIRINSRLWCYLPQISFDYTLSDVKPDQLLFLTRSLIASERLSFAHRVLSKLKIQCEMTEFIKELEGDCYLLEGNYNEAGNIYMELISKLSSECDNLEAILCKAARVYFEVDDLKKLSLLVSKFGPILILPEELDNKLFNSEKTLVLLSSHLKRVQGILLILSGIKYKNIRYFKAGVFLWINNDPYKGYGRGWVSGLKVAKLLANFMKSKEPWEAKDELKEFFHIMNRLYLVEPIIFPAEDRSLPEAMETGRHNDFTMKLLYILIWQELNEKSEVFLIRYRNDIEVGIELETGAIIVDMKMGPIPFNEWKKMKISEFPDLNCNVYLKKLGEMSIIAETHFRAGIIKAFRDYSFDKGKKEIIKSLKIDPENVTALITLSEIELIQNNIKNAQMYLNQALKLDPDHPDIRKLLNLIEKSYNRATRQQKDLKKNLEKS